MKRSALFVTVVPVLVIAAWMIGAAHPPWTPSRVGGLILAVFGFTMLTIARVQLGNAFSVSPQANMLVKRGIYSRVRHPVYVFSALGLVGLALYVRIPALLILVAAIVPVQVIRARREERVLEVRFGEDYRAYKRATWF